MLTNKDINQKYEKLLEKRNNLRKIARVIREACEDLNIEIAGGNRKLMSELVEQTGQFKVLKDDYIASWDTLVAQLTDAGYSAPVVECMTDELKYGNWII